MTTYDPNLSTTENLRRFGFAHRRINRGNLMSHEIIEIATSKIVTEMTVFEATAFLERLSDLNETA